MNPVLKTILGSVGRHWLGAFLTIIGVRIGLHSDVAAQATAQLTDEMVSNFVIVVLATLVSVGGSIWHALRERLRLKIALLLHHGETEAAVDAVLGHSARRSQAAAVLAGDPGRLAP